MKITLFKKRTIKRGVMVNLVCLARTVFSQTDVQLCIIHQIRNLLKYFSCKNQKEFLADLKFVHYTAEIRKLIYATSTVEGCHRQIRKVTKTKGWFSSDGLCQWPFVKNILFQHQILATLIFAFFISFFVFQHLFVLVEELHVQVLLGFPFLRRYVS